MIIDTQITPAERVALDEALKQDFASTPTPRSSPSEWRTDFRHALLALLSHAHTETSHVEKNVARAAQYADAAAAAYAAHVEAEGDQE